MDAHELLARAWGIVDDFDPTPEHVDDRLFATHLDILERALLSYPGLNYAHPEARTMLAARLRAIAATLESV